MGKQSVLLSLLLQPQALLNAEAVLLASYADNIAALTARWIGSGERYGRVG